MKFCVFFRSLPFLDSMATPAWAKKHAVTLATAPHKLPVLSKLYDGRFQTVSFFHFRLFHALMTLLVPFM